MAGDNKKCVFLLENLVESMQKAYLKGKAKAAEKALGGAEDEIGPDGVKTGKPFYPEGAWKAEEFEQTFPAQKQGKAAKLANKLRASSLSTAKVHPEGA